MTHTPKSNHILSEEEWNEMDALRKVIKQNPASVHPDKMELFTQLLVRSWSEIGRDIS